MLFARKPTSLPRRLTPPLATAHAIAEVFEFLPEWVNQTFYLGDVGHGRGRQDFPVVRLSPSSANSDVRIDVWLGIHRPHHNP